MTRLRAAALALAVLAAQSSHAAETIVSFTSDIVVNADSTMTVTEEIVVTAEGNRIRRGIFRDFPTRYRDAAGNRYEVGFSVVTAERDGRPEKFRVQSRSNGVRVYLGDEDIFLDPGEYRYSLTYDTHRQLGYFSDHDELYWNATGNGWVFPIERAAASVTLPDGVPMERVSAEAYTGPTGARGDSYRADVYGGQAYFETTTVLAPYEGLTIVVQWPKGFVTAPSAGQRTLWFLMDNRSIAGAGVATLAGLAYLFMAWFKAGRDPKPGVIFPHYEPPAGLSPGAVSFVRSMGYGHQAFAAGLISLAVKGYARIEEDKGDFSIHRSRGEASLSQGEKALWNGLPREQALVLEQKNHKTVRKIRREHQAALKREYQGRYFITNANLTTPAWLLTLGGFAWIVISDHVQPAAIALVVLAFIACFVFQFLLKAPTPAGRKILDQVEGFKQYLEIAEKDEINLRNPPEKTPELFERLLPFALALGVEQPWADKFARVFAQVDESGESYRPAWYSGHWDTRRAGFMSHSLSSGLTQAIASSSSPPGSSSGGGGGGSSGGGGGGGGGGGW